MTAIIGWFLGTKIGRGLATAAGIAVAAAILFWRVFTAGKDAEAAKQAQASLENLRNRSKTDDEIARMPADARKRRLAEWVSDDRK